MSKGTQTSPAAKIIIDAIKHTSGNLFQECPYFGGYEANITVSKNIVSFIPHELYKFSVLANNEYDDDFFHVSVVIEIKWIFKKKQYLLN